ncbi:hypothetical protein NH340_JMT02927 [Sarcoptes scabiei]|uniref:Cytochrome c oxidase assembly factor 4 -like protein, mitochondrial n=1 Tax=Sarcoptes scabiei TaxID=52283 RepID=A0A131ZZH5_SARSC|nr:hypothetical protein QR98_0023480 [Sarcoptes scabiei]UXI16984.1 hypothetical protein NH340_JMT02927 [Sarcoptes scabiei]
MSPLNQEEEDKDALEEMLDRTGCKNQHFALQECMYEHKDWRKCQNLVNELRDCMRNYERLKHQAQILSSLPSK